jgi:hypothetical protein
VRAILAIATVLGVLAVGAPAAGAAAYGPPAGSVFHGGLGGYGANAVADFTAQSGKHPAVFQYFVNWRSAPRDLGFVERLVAQTQAAGSRTALAVTTNGTPLTPRAIARGEGDAFLVGLNAIAARHASAPTYVRLLSEMNNGANSYAAYDEHGRSRGRAFTPGQFVRAWRRATLVLRGGGVAAMDKRLARLGMPALRTAAAALPRPPVSMQWVPLSGGNPEVARNDPARWWPGSRYVDWVGSTWYSLFARSDAFAHFMDRRPWRSKPFVFGEYGVWGADSPAFIDRFFDFVGAHRRVRMISYYESALLKPAFRLSSHPRSRAALRRRLSASRFLG